ncbi:hypothetical protein [Sphingomonas sp. 1P08PE]|uniref:hypothetical protein n=1 Tax=Sphingomonas sp. 1P08PE TaxID=554122 RepID=UPI0039A2931E
MVHDLGPRRFEGGGRLRDEWTRTTLGCELLSILAGYGLDQRDASIGEGPSGLQVWTDRGSVQIIDDELGSCRDELDIVFSSVAAGVAQERMLRLDRWLPGEELPQWAVTASDVLAKRVCEHHVSPARIWNSGVNIDEDGWIDRPSFSTCEAGRRASDPRNALPDDCVVQRHGTGMYMSWHEGELFYYEYLQGATLQLPLSLLPAADPGELVGQTLGSVCEADGELARALARYPIAKLHILAPHPLSLENDPVTHVDLTLGVPMRTLGPVPDRALERAGIALPGEVDRDRPLWVLTPPEALLRYKPRLPRAG